MLEKNKKQYILTLGSNDNNISQKDFDNLAILLEQHGNKAYPVKHHITAIEICDKCNMSLQTVVSCKCNCGL